MLATRKHVIESKPNDPRPTSNLFKERGCKGKISDSVKSFKRQRKVNHIRETKSKSLQESP